MLISDYSHTALHVECASWLTEPNFCDRADSCGPACAGFICFFSVNQPAVAKLSGTCPLRWLINDNAYKRKF